MLTLVNSDFASNAGLDFKTPEEFFLDAKPEQVIRKFDPTSYINGDPDAAGKSLPLPPQRHLSVTQLDTITPHFS